MHIVIMPDKFKGSLTAQEAAKAIRIGFQTIFPKATFELCPLADGGEGILAAFAESQSGAVHFPVNVKNALGKNQQAEYLLIDECAIIESSQANGLAIIPPAERNIHQSNTFGVGELILAATKSGAKKIIIGIGGSATNDAGIGLAAALGCVFYDKKDQSVVPIPANFRKITRIDSSHLPPLPVISVACDVTNPLLGSRGASHVYGPQKGLLADEILEMETALEHISHLANDHFGTDFRDHPGAGAAGGLGYGLMTFCNAKLESGFDCIAQALRAEEKIKLADLVITAEGSLDSQTLEGKTPYGVSRLARKQGKPVYAISGCLADEDLLQAHFDGLAPLVNAPMSLENAMQNARPLLEKAACRLAHIIARSST